MDIVATCSNGENLEVGFALQPKSDASTKGPGKQHPAAIMRTIAARPFQWTQDTTLAPVSNLLRERLLRDMIALSNSIPSNGSGSANNMLMNIPPYRHEWDGELPPLPRSSQVHAVPTAACILLQVGATLVLVTCLPNI